MPPDKLLDGLRGLAGDFLDGAFHGPGPGRLVAHMDTLGLTRAGTQVRP